MTPLNTNLTLEQTVDFCKGKHDGNCVLIVLTKDLAMRKKIKAEQNAINKKRSPCNRVVFVAVSPTINNWIEKTVGFLCDHIFVFVDEFTSLDQREVLSCYDGFGTTLKNT